MKIKIEYEGEDDKLTPINMAKAISEFMLSYHAYNGMWMRDFKEMVEHLNVIAKYIRIRESEGEF